MPEKQKPFKRNKQDADKRDIMRQVGRQMIQKVKPSGKEYDRKKQLPKDESVTPPTKPKQKPQ